MGANVFLEHEDLKSILSADDPDCLFEELEQIGHGNFGAVYCGKDTRDGCSVAIKKISCDKKQVEQKINDIAVELKVMKRLNHKNTVSLKDVFAKDLTVWLVMEYCVGSLTDVMVALKKPFGEQEIASISHSVLNGLDFLHSLSWIHRDIKAANILITSQAVVKLADFGSTSLRDPANTFVGSPYWMAPEVIMAMEDGLYDKLCDIWSFGITLIELAETKPPLFDMNSMSALYYIAQNDPPSFSHPEAFSPSFIDFVGGCLQKEPADRKSAQQLLNSDFLVSIEPDHDMLQDLINDCFSKVADDNNENYEKVKSFVHHCDTETLSDVSTSTNSVTSQGTTTTTTTESSNKMVRKKKNLPKGNTIKMNATIAHETLFHENDGYKENMQEYNNLRRNLVKQVNALDARLKAFRAEMLRSLEKELEATASSLEKNVEKMKQKADLEFEQLLKNQIQAEKKLLKHLGVYKSKTKNSTSEVNFYPELFRLRQEQLVERMNFNQKSQMDIITHFTKEKKVYYEKKLLHTRTINHLVMDHYNQIGRVKLGHLEQIQSLELTNTKEYGRKMLLQLRRKHIAELRQKPKTLKQIEATMKKMKADQVKTQTAQFKKLIEEAQAKNSKEDVAKIKEQLKKERLKKITRLDVEYNELIAKRTMEVDITLENQQIKEVEELTAKLESERSQLQAYQDLMKKNMASKNEKRAAELAQETGSKEQQVVEYVNSKIEELDREVELKRKEFEDALCNTVQLLDEEKKKFDGNQLEAMPISANDLLGRASKSFFFYKLF